MHGVNKKVIEITEPENELIERVIVFLKPGHDVRLQRNQEQAREYVSGLCCKRRKKLIWVFAAVGVLLVAGFIAALCLL